MTLKTWYVAQYNNNASFVRILWDSPDWGGEDGDTPQDPSATREISSITYKNLWNKTFFIEVKTGADVSAWDFPPGTPETTINIPKPQRPSYLDNTVISAGYRAA